MKSIGLSIIVFLLISCSNQNNSDDTIADSAAVAEIQVLLGESVPEEDEPQIDDFQQVYLYSDSTNNLYQVLGVNWLTNDSIQFLLISDNELCEYKVTGIAVNKYPDGDLEIDEDSEGLSYPVEEFIVFDKGQLYSIRIELDEKSMAKIRYNYSEPRDECDPKAEIIMKVSHQQQNKASSPSAFSH